VDRPSAQSVLAELGLEPRLTIYLASAPGAGKTHRLLTDAIAQLRAGRRVAIGWVETKDRPDLDELAARLPRIPPRRFGGFEDFDLEAALASDYETIVLDELAHGNPEGAPHAKRWQDALALRDAGKSVLGAFNASHLETVAPVAERILNYPIREIVPLSFLKRADTVIALDVSPSVLEARLRGGRIVPAEDVERAAAGAFRPQNLELLRALLLRIVDDLTVPIIAPARTSSALAIVLTGIDAEPYLRRVAGLAEAMDLALETAVIGPIDDEAYTEARLAADASRVDAPPRLERGEIEEVRATLVTVPNGELAEKILARPVDRDVYIVDPERPPITRSLDGARHPYGHVFGDRLKIGYGTLTIYLGSVAGSGKTYAMLDRAQQMRAEGVDVVGALIETHGRAETEAKVEGIERLARLPNGELDRLTLLERRPQYALIDELAHTNAAGSAFAKRYDDVLNILRAGINVITTLNVQHLEGLGDAVERLTGTRVRETVPDAILEVADELIFIDVAPDVIRQRLREGKIYPSSRVDTALANFFRTENLAALRELAVREVVHARLQRRHARPFDRIVLGVSPRERDIGLVERMGRLAGRLDVDLRVVAVLGPGEDLRQPVLDALRKATRAAKGNFLADRAEHPAQRLVAIAGPTDVIAVESPRRGRRLFGKSSFALRLLRAGAREVIVLAPRSLIDLESDQK
jgi:two-component system, OmpR family, sensor histidine kinase KdpD